MVMELPKAPRPNGLGNRGHWPPAQSLRLQGPLLVPKDSLWMMGDNRHRSQDSRFWGFVPRENVRGRPLFVYYSWNADDSDRPWPAITDIRWSRIGHRFK